MQPEVRVGNVNEAGNAAPQVDQRVQLHGALAATRLRPRKQTQTQIDGRRIEGVDRLLEIDCQRFRGVQPPGSTNQGLRKIGVDSPIVSPIGVGQRAARNVSAKARVMQLGLEGAEAGFDVSQAPSKRELRKTQTQELVATREASRWMVAAVLADARIELAPRQKVRHSCPLDGRSHRRARRKVLRAGSALLHVDLELPKCPAVSF